MKGDNYAKFKYRPDYNERTCRNKKYVIRKCQKSYEILVTSLEENVRKKVTERKEKTTALAPINYVVPEEQKKLALAKCDLIKNWDTFRNGNKNKTVASKDFLEELSPDVIREIEEKTLGITY